MQHSVQHHEVTAPKQTKLLGATVHNLGLVVAVSSTLAYGYAIVEGEDRVNHRVALSDLKREAVVFPTAPQPYRTQTERVAVGTWDEVHTLMGTGSLVPAQPVVLAVAA